MPVHGWFSTPIYIHDCEGGDYEVIQEELVEVVNQLDFDHNSLFEGSFGKSTHKLNTEGFGESILHNYSCNNFLGYLHNNLMEYLNQIGSDQTPYLLKESWFTETTEGQYAHQHDHGAFDVSGVYYVNTSGEDGNLYLTNVLSNLSSNYIYDKVINPMEIPPKNGRLLLWPGLIPHGTRINKTDSRRISLSFNIQFLRDGFTLKTTKST